MGTPNIMNSLIVLISAQEEEKNEKKRKNKEEKAFFGVKDLTFKGTNKKRKTE